MPTEGNAELNLRGRGMSHALRTPLAAVLMSVELAAEGANAQSRVQLDQLTRTVEGLVEALKGWSQRAPTPTQVSQTALAIRTLGLQLKPFWETVAPLAAASQRLEFLVRTFEWMHRVGDSPALVLEDDVFCEGLKVALVHGRKRERTPDLEVFVVRGDQKFNVSDWVLVWQAVDCFEIAQSQVLEQMTVTVNRGKGIALRVSQQTHNLPWT